MSVVGVGVISVPVADQERSLAFYRDHLGFAIENDSPMGPTMRWLQLRAPGTDFTLTLVTWFDNMPPGSMAGLVLSVDDIDALASRLHDAGVLEDPTVQVQPWGRHVVIHDPDGNSLVLNQPPG